MYRKTLELLLIVTPLVLGIVFAFVDPFPTGEAIEGSVEVTCSESCNADDPDLPPHLRKAG